MKMPIREQKIVCVVDDNKPMLDVMRKALELQKYKVFTYEVFPGIEKIAEIYADMVYLDVSLKNQDGREVSRAIKSGEKTKDIPIIILTGHMNASELAAQAGADGYLLKPFDFATLWKLTEKYTSS